MKRIRTAVIPAGGYGTRFLPATKSIPKEMFPIDNKPVILRVVEEVVAAGIERIIFIVSHHKQAVESFFGPNQPLEDYYAHHNKTTEVKELQRISGLADYAFVYTAPPYGNGGALRAVREFVEDEAFVVVWADELVWTPAATPSRVERCLRAFEHYGKPIISMMKIADPMIRSRYGMADIRDIAGDPTVKEIVRIVEKPLFGTEPSEYAAHSTYVLPPSIFQAFEHTKSGKDGELWLADLINTMKEKTGLFGVVMDDAVYMDCGNPKEYLLSQIQYALLTDAPYAEDIRRLIQKT